MKRHFISLAIGAGFVLNLLVACPASAGLLSFQGWAIEQDEQDDTGYHECNFIVLSPDNKHAYTPHYNRKVILFDRDALTGKLRFVQSRRDGTADAECLSSVFAIQVSLDGKHVYTVSLHDNALSLFSRDNITGKLTFIECHQENKGGVNGIVSPWSLALSPDNKYIYAAGCDSHSVAVFSRNALTGRLTFVEAQKKSIGHIEGLDGITSLTISPDNKNLYAVGSRNATLTVFSRDIMSGKLALVETQKNGRRGVEGLAGAQFIIASQDSRNIYVAGFRDDALAVFDRDPADGKLTFIQVLKNGAGDLEGIRGICALALSPNQKYLYAISQADHALTVFSRDEQTGRLALREVHKHGLRGVYGLSASQHLTVSADGKFIYILGRSKTGEKPVLFSIL